VITAEYLTFLLCGIYGAVFVFLVEFTLQNSCFCQASGAGGKISGLVVVVIFVAFFSSTEEVSIKPEVECMYAV
jgi:hypothetical protein